MGWFDSGDKFSGYTDARGRPITDKQAKEHEEKGRPILWSSDPKKGNRGK